MSRRKSMTVVSFGIALAFTFSNLSMLLIVAIPDMRIVRAHAGMMTIQYIGTAHAVAMLYFFAIEDIRRAATRAGLVLLLLAMCGFGCVVTLLDQVCAQMIIPSGLSRWTLMTETLNCGVVGVMFYGGWSMYLARRIISESSGKKKIRP